MEKTIKKSQLKSTDDIISLRDIIDIFLINWKWFILSVIICLGLGYLYLMTKPRIYKRSAVMLVKDDNGNMSSARSKIGTDALMQLNGVVMGSSVKNEVYILQSHQIMMDVVRRLRLDVTYDCKHHLKNISLYDFRPFTAVFDTIETEHPYAFQVELQGNDARITNLLTKDGKLEFEATAKLGQPISTPFGKLTLLPAGADTLQTFDGKTINVTHLTVEQAANGFGAPLKAGEIDKESTLVGITYTDQNIKRADDILNAVLSSYQRGIIDDKNRIAQSTAEFIDQRIALISKELSEVEGELAEFKQRNRLVNIKDDATTFLQQSSQARQRSIQLESQVQAIQYLLENLKDKANGNDLIPSLSGVTDAGIQSQIMKYNELLLERNRLAENTGENSPRIVQTNQRLEQMRSAIIASTDAFLASMNVQLRRAKQEEQGLSGTLSGVPEKEKKALDIQRQQTIKETLYTYLLNKREETALQLAITEANIRVVETPFGSDIPISPRKKIVLLIALMLGIVIPFAFFHIRNLLNVSVRGRKDIETYTSIPVLGEIPHHKKNEDDSEILVGEQRTDPINEAFRMLRFSLNFVNKDARVIMFTSTTPSEGKTFVSRNFAVTLGMTGKKVILLDTDIRKRTQSKLAGITHREGLTSYLSGNTDNIEKLIVKDLSDHHVDMLPAGIVPPNPSELLMSERLEQLVDELKKCYDYIIIDNVPAQVVADAGIVNRVADVTLYVIREGKIDRRYLPELQRLYEEKKFNNLCIIINDAKIEQKRYGYGNYGYGRYGYGYGYGYGNEKSKKSK